MGISNRKHQESFNEINITPLTDIFLVLLVIMMVIAPLLTQEGLKLTIPNYQEKVQKEKDSKIINVNVDVNNKYTIDGKQINENDLLYTIKETLKTKKDGLMIHAKENATHGAVVKIMDIARNAGIDNISISEIAESSGSTAP